MGVKVLLLRQGKSSKTVTRFTSIHSKLANAPEHPSWTGRVNIGPLLFGLLSANVIYNGYGYEDGVWCYNVCFWSDGTTAVKKYIAAEKQ
jgi:hypothetical protein